MVEIIPAINCTDEGCVKDRIARTVKLGANWAHIDVSDGVFTPITTWNNPQAVDGVKVKIEVHLMVKKPRRNVKRWLRAGAKRIIVHIESKFNLGYIKKLCDEHGAELMLALKPDTPVGKLEPFLEKIDNIQLLAVSPGLSDQEFQPQILDKARALLEQHPDVTIEIDGGINTETIRLARDIGVQIVTSGSYIFNGPDSKRAYERLMAILKN